MEKSGEFQFMVFCQSGSLFLRLPGGQTIPYDGRFADCPPLIEGNQFIKIIED